MSEPFSVAMCVYGGDDPVHFREAVESILHQTVRPDEIVLVVDGPVPQALDGVIREYEREPLFHIVRLPQNRGHGEARSRGIAACNHSLIALMDADDLSVPERFELQLSAFAAQPELSIVGGQIEEFETDPAEPVGRRVVPTDDDAIKDYLKHRCPMNQVTVMFKKENALSVRGYLDWYCNEDYYLWVRMALAQMKFANVAQTLVRVRVSADTYARRGGWKYFRSEQRLQKLMRRNKIISLPQYWVNVTKRLIVQVLLPNRLRGWVFKTFARE